MARKPNYAFERNARAKAKSAKRQAKLAAKANRSAQATVSQSDVDPAGQVQPLANEHPDDAPSEAH